MQSLFKQKEIPLSEVLKKRSAVPYSENSSIYLILPSYAEYFSRNVEFNIATTAFSKNVEFNIACSNSRIIKPHTLGGFIVIMETI